MADAKISALDNLTSADPANDMIPIVDVSATPPASGNTKRISINNLLACSPSATLASATITGDLTVDTSTLKVDSTNNQVGIGTATPASYAGNKLVVYDSTNGQIAIANSTANSNLQSNGVDLYINTNVTGASSNAGSFIVRHGSGFATQLTIDSSNNVNVQNGNVVMVTSGKGIDFSATANGSGTMTSELLNDYEEGTFTPTIVGNTIAGVGVYVNQVGIYTKVGNQVTVWVNIEWSAHTGTGTQMYLGGLPFNVRVLTGYNACATIGLISNIALTAGNFPLIMAANSDNYARFFQSPTGGGVTTAIPMDTAGQVVLSMTYTV